MSNKSIPSQISNESKVADAIVELHEKGFIHDFQIVENKLYWIQGKASIPAGNFSILEIDRIPGSGTTVFGILANDHNIKGILLDQIPQGSSEAPSLLNQKIIQLHLQTLIETCL